VLDVMNVFEPARSPGHCLLAELPSACDRTHACKLRRLFDEVDEVARNTFASITLETLAGRRAEGRVAGPPAERAVR